MRKKISVIYWSSCYTLDKPISFVEFLKNEGAYETFMENVQIHNQRWSKIKTYIELEDLKKKKADRWLYDAFNWSRSREEYDYWETLCEKWLEEIEENTVWE